jgi:hypothetical protein
MFKYLSVLVLLVVALPVFAGQITPYNLSSTIPTTPFPGSGDYDMFYCGTTTYYWDFTGADCYLAVYFDPADNLGDTFSVPFTIVEVDSLWYGTSDGDYPITICPESGGFPDMGNPYHTGTISDPAIYPTYASYEVTPPVHLDADTPFYVVIVATMGVSETETVDEPMTDGDGNSGHSLYSWDGAAWDMAFTGVEDVDFMWHCFANDASAVQSNSLGHVKALFN